MSQIPTFEVVLVFLVLAVGGPLLLILAVVLLAVPASRRRTGLRRTGYVFLALALCLLAPLAPLLAQVWYSYRQKWDFETRTYHLTAPRTFYGTTFPADSTVHVSKAGVPEFGILPHPTQVGGLVLVGRFDVQNDGEATDPLAVAQGTLAAPAAIHDVPCGPGAVTLEERATSCVLAREWIFAGHPLAAGQPVIVWHSPPQETPLLFLGTLARPELLYDVLWPAGTAVSGLTEPLERMEHGPGPESHGVDFCLAPGYAVAIPGAVLHGSLTYGAVRDKRTVWPACSQPFGGDFSNQGYAEVGPDHFIWGNRPDAGSAWQWRNQP